MIWNQIPIALRYREDIAANFDSILSMCWLMNKENAGASNVNLVSKELRIKLTFEWNDDLLKLHGTFEPINERFVSYARFLGNNDTIVISKAIFLREWNTLLRQLFLSVQASGHTMVDGTERRKFEMLERTEALINGYGKLYVQN